MVVCVELDSLSYATRQPREVKAAPVMIVGSGTSA
jgi:hypothetical protein